MFIGHKLRRKSGEPKSIAYLDVSYANAGSASSATHSNMDLGDPSPARSIAVVVRERNSGNSLTISSCTIGGVSATRLVHIHDGFISDAYNMAIFIAEVPTGDTGDIVVTLSGTPLGSHTQSIAVYRVASLDNPNVANDSLQTEAHLLQARLTWPMKALYWLGGGILQMSMALSLGLVQMKI